MTVDELRTELATLPGHLEVVVENSCCGCTNEAMDVYLRSVLIGEDEAAPDAVAIYG